MGTISENILGGQAGETVVRDVDVVMSHDATTPLAIQAFENLGRDKVFDPSKVVIVFDHVYPASTPAIAAMHRNVERFVREQKIPNFFKGAGICHQVLPEKGFVQPGRVVIGADSHSCTYGAFGAFGTGMGSTDIAVIWATGQTWIDVPQSICVTLEGILQNRVTAKDIILELIHILGPGGANDQAIEYAGSFAETAEMNQRMTLANMSVDAGGTTGLFPAESVTPSKDAQYVRTETIDVAALEPQVSGPDKIEAVQPVSAVAGTTVNQVVIGSCTNGRIEDLRQVVELSKGKKFAVDTYIFPASAEVQRQAIEEGLAAELIRSGAVFSSSGCGPCLGRHQGTLADGDVCFSTTSRNYPGRMGSPKAQIYLGSPYTATATALTGKISDPRSIA